MSQPPNQVRVKLLPKTIDRHAKSPGDYRFGTETIHEESKYHDNTDLNPEQSSDPSIQNQDDDYIVFNDDLAKKRTKDGPKDSSSTGTAVFDNHHPK